MESTYRNSNAFSVQPAHPTLGCRIRKTPDRRSVCILFGRRAIAEPRKLSRVGTVSANHTTDANRLLKDGIRGIKKPRRTLACGMIHGEDMSRRATVAAPMSTHEPTHIFHVARTTHKTEIP
ncbi:MAG: hypothetical protein D6741_13170 [Planctomycetota bacterium]|nr:MAG: hypothetical protein D6741_13170 [Planctomycetota bacterium]